MHRFEYLKGVYCKESYMGKKMFADRSEAAQALTPLLKRHERSNAVVLGLPRGGVVVASAVAKALSLPLDVIVVKKVTPLYNDEFAVGAVTEDGDSFYDWTLNEESCGPKDTFQARIDEKQKEVRARAARYRAVLPLRNLRGKAAIVVDDGIATGSTMRAAIRAARTRGAAKVVVAVPVAPRDSFAAVRGEADEAACPNTVDFFPAVGQFYDAFPQVEDEEVLVMLKDAAGRT